MIKGINKQILEVTNTESPYFEKIIFFVRPTSSKISESKLQEEAEKLSHKMKKPPREKKSFMQFFSTGLFMFLGLGAGCALTFIISGIIK
ncbi:MAG: hypothetical protein IJR70_06665 [Eubacterium sp.]|nr:hypothetical protein [Eubacterium sp.]